MIVCMYIPYFYPGMCSVWLSSLTLLLLVLLIVTYMYLYAHGNYRLNIRNTNLCIIGASVSNPPLVDGRFGPQVTPRYAQT